MGAVGGAAEVGLVPQLAKLREISECAALLGAVDSVRLRTWSPDHAKVVGVETGIYSGGKVIKATKWGAVALAIWDNIPELRPALRIHTGWPADFRGM